MTWKHHLSIGKCYRAANIQVFIFVLFFKLGKILKAQAFDEIEKSIHKNGNDANLGEMADIMLSDGNKDEAIRLGCKFCHFFFIQFQRNI